MLKKNVTVKDQFGTEYSIQATVDKNSCSTMLHSNLRYITIDGEDIRPGFEMLVNNFSAGIKNPKATKLYNILEADKFQADVINM